MKDTKLFVILGMHRSGTSVVSRGLKVLGVDLGNRLIVPDKFNPKGYWEDLDINQFNDEQEMLLATKKILLRKIGFLMSILIFSKYFHFT